MISILTYFIITLIGLFIGQKLTQLINDKAENENTALAINIIIIILLLVFACWNEGVI